MSRRPVISLADLIRATGHLEVSRDGDVAALAGLLGVASQAPAPVPQDRRPSSTDIQLPGQSSPGRTPIAPPADRGVTPHRHPVERRPDDVATADVVPLPPVSALRGSPRNAPDLDTLLAVPPSGAANEDLSLFVSRWQRGIVSGLAGTERPAGDLDVLRVVEEIAAGRAVHRLPRIDVHTTRAGLQILIDIGEGMRPFIDDVVAMERLLETTAGADGVLVQRFDRTPASGVGAGPRSTWEPYRAPASGTPVLLLSDFGLATVPHESNARTDWVGLAEAAAAARCPVVALTPFPPGRWPAWLTARFTVLHWDRSTNAGAALRAARGAARRR